MTGSDSILLVYLRQIDKKADRVIEDVRELKVRMTAVSEALVGIDRRLDRIELPH